MLPVESNTSANNKNINALWLSPDEWLIYGKDIDKDLEISLNNEISKLKYGSVTNVSDQWVIINLKGKNTFELLSKGSPFNFNNFKEKKMLLFKHY